MIFIMKYELRKILTGRLALISVSAVLLFSALLTFSSFSNMYAFDGVSREGSGRAAVELEKDIAAEYEGVLSDEKVQQMLSDFKPKSDLHGMNAKYLYQNSLQSAAFARFADMDGNWNGLSVTDVFGDEEIKIAYINGWLITSLNLSRVMLLLSIVLILLLAPVFSGEYGGLDNIILTSRYGKTKCAAAKVAAGLVSAAVLTALVTAFHLVPAFFLYGRGGLGASILFSPVEFAENYIPFNLSCAELLEYQLLLGFMSAVSITGMTLLFSALCKNPLAAFISSAAVYVMPRLLPVPETSSFYRLVVLQPVYYSQFISILSVEQMKSGLLYAVLSIPFSALLFLLGALTAPKFFAKHQVT